MKHCQSLAFDLYLIDGIIFYKQQIVVTSTLRSHTLTKFHLGHLVVQNIEAMAIQILYRRCTDAGVETLALKCSLRCRRLRVKQKEHLQKHSVSQFAW